MNPPITSLQNQRVKDAIKLRNHRDRDKQGRFLIDGVREIEHAIAGGIPIVEAFVCPEICADSSKVVAELTAAGAQVLTVSEAVWDKLTFGNRRDGRLVIAEPPERSLSDIDPGPIPFVVILEAIEKPGNVGAVIRSADAAGVTAVLITQAATDLFNPNTIRSSLGTVFRMPVASCSNAEAKAWLRQYNITPFAAIVEADTDYTKARFSSPCAIVMGSEANGLSSDWRGSDVTGVSLPMNGLADSLNISTSAAILMYEVVRQRRTV